MPEITANRENVARKQQSCDFCYVLPSRSWSSRAIASRMPIERKRKELSRPQNPRRRLFLCESEPEGSSGKSTISNCPTNSNSRAMCRFEHSYSGIFQNRANRRACFVGVSVFEVLDKSFYAGVASIELS